MTMSLTMQIIYFGGYRQEAVSRRNGALGALRAVYKPSKTWENLWQSDSLAQRWRRATEWLGVLPKPERFIVAGYSMGSHLAVRFALQMMLMERRIDGIYLFAPDPKFRICQEDRNDKDRGDASAYEEACELWQSSRSPGAEMTATSCGVARKVREVRKVGEVWITYSKLDKTSEWSENVEYFVRDLTRLARFSRVGKKPAPIGERLMVSITESGDVHKQLYHQVRRTR